MADEHGTGLAIDATDAEGAVQQDAEGAVQQDAEGAVQQDVTVAKKRSKPKSNKPNVFHVRDRYVKEHRIGKVLTNGAKKTLVNVLDAVMQQVGIECYLHSTRRVIVKGEKIDGRRMPHRLVQPTFTPKVAKTIFLRVFSPYAESGKLVADSNLP